MRDHKACRQPLGDRMVGIDGPDPLLLAAFAPGQSAAGAHRPAEDLRHVAGMHHDESHSGQQAVPDALDQLVLDFAVGAVPPPHQHIGVVEQRIGQPLLRIIQGRSANQQVVAFERLRQLAMDALRIDCGNLGQFLFMTPLVPNCYLDHLLSGIEFLVIVPWKREAPPPRLFLPRQEKSGFAPFQAHARPTPAF